MSGLEEAGIAASILQIAEIGTRLAVKLCAFYHKIKTADQRIQNLSNNVALTSNVLRLLGDNLRQDDQAKLYSDEAYKTTQGVLDECKGVFEQIKNAIDQDSNRSRIQRVAHRLKFVVIEQELDLLGRNLDRLSSTLHLMLNVIMYAGQLRSRAQPASLKDQRDLIQTLLDHKKESERRFDDLTKAIQASIINDKSADEPNTEHLVNASFMPDINKDLPIDEDLFTELTKYYALVKKLLANVDSYRSSLEHSQYCRIRDGVLHIHNVEIRQIKSVHGRHCAEKVASQLSTETHSPPNRTISSPCKTNALRDRDIMPECHRKSDYSANSGQQSFPVAQNSFQFKGAAEGSKRKSSVSSTMSDNAGAHEAVKGRRSEEVQGSRTSQPLSKRISIKKPKLNPEYTSETFANEASFTNASDDATSSGSISSSSAAITSQSKRGLADMKGWQKDETQPDSECGGFPEPHPQPLFIFSSSYYDNLSVNDSPESAKTNSPIVKVESYSRGDTPNNDVFNWQNPTNISAPLPQSSVFDPSHAPPTYEDDHGYKIPRFAELCESIGNAEVGSGNKDLNRIDDLEVHADRGPRDSKFTDQKDVPPKTDMEEIDCLVDLWTTVKRESFQTPADS